MKVAQLLKQFGLFIFMMTVFEFGVSYFFIHNSENDARVINMAGHVRGLSQRVLKLDYAGKYNEAAPLTAELKKIISGLQNGDDSMGIKKLNDGQFQRLMGSVAVEWGALERIIEESKAQPESFNQLLVASEDFYVLSDRAVLAAEEASKNKVILSEIVQFVLVFFEIIALFLLRQVTIRKVIKPLKTVSSILPKAAGGDLSQRLPMKGNDEFGEIADVFNKLLSRQQDLIGSLDKKVKEKTRDLEIKILEVAHGKKKAEDEKKEIEKLLVENEKFRLALEGASDHVIITDAEGIILYANKAAEKITGYALPEMLGKKAGQMWGGLMNIAFYENMWQTIKKDANVFKGIIKNKRKNGEIYDSALSISPIVDKDGKPQYYVGIERDISEELAVDKAKTEFVSVASHQLRTPLTAINWYVEMLESEREGKLTKKQKEYLDEIADGNKRMVTLVNNLLSVSRIELGTFPVYLEEADLCTVLNDVVKDFKPISQQKKVKINLSCSVKSVVMKIDISLSRFIFQNLISNAVKYSPEKSSIDVVIKNDGKNALISVVDKGIGIPEFEQKNIFTKFYRAKNVGKKDTDGTGLGLYIVKSVSDFLGGKVWFDSKEGVGSTFYFSVPLTGMKQTKNNN